MVIAGVSKTPRAYGSAPQYVGSSPTSSTKGKILSAKLISNTIKEFADKFIFNTLEVS